MSLLQSVLIGFIIYLGLYAIIDRICKCAEHCSMAKSYGTAVGNVAKNIKPEEK